MRLALVFIIAACGAAAQAVEPDPIDKLVASLSATHGLWVNGISEIIDLPATASTEQVIATAFKLADSTEGHGATSYKIVKVRQVHLTGPQPDLYTAVLVRTKSGDKVVLLQYTGHVLGWMHRIYDAKTLEWTG